MSGWDAPDGSRGDWSDPWGDGRDQEAARDFRRAKSAGARFGATLIVAAIGAAIAVTAIRSLPPLPTFDGIVFPSVAAGGSPVIAAASGSLLPSTPPELLAPAIAPAMGLVTTWSEDSAGVNAAACGFSGSGVLLADGYVLTASHVIEADYTGTVPADCNWGNILVMFIKNVENAPDYWYKATIIADDPVRDVALLHISAPVFDAPAISSLPALTVYAEPGPPTLGMQLIFMGYPGIGGNTLSLSVGMVSGYDQLESGVKTLKTDAVLAGGSSGGPGVDALGRVVGIVMQAGSPSANDFIDCRPYDTNGNGRIDAADSCMQVGGQFVTLLDSREIVTFLTEQGHPELVNGARQ